MSHKPCPDCEGHLSIRKNQLTDQWFYGCSNYPQCKHTESVADSTTSSLPAPAEPVITAAEMEALRESERIGFEQRKDWHLRNQVPFPEDKEIFPNGFTAEFAFAMLYKRLNEMTGKLPYDKTEREPVPIKKGNGGACD